MQFVTISVDTSGLYQVATRDTGTVAVVGVGTTPGSGSMAPVKLGSYSEVDNLYPTDSDLSIAIKKAFENGAASVWAVDLLDEKSEVLVESALELLERKDVQIVVIANTVEEDDATYISSKLLNHVKSAITERVGVFMLASGEDASTAPTSISSMFAANENRMFCVAHNSDVDVAAAVAGLLASIDPWESPVMKTISGVSSSSEFTTTQLSLMDAANINPVFDPLYLSGTSNVLRTEYTLGSRAGGIYLLDVRRTIDDISYKLKTGLTNPNVIGNIRINKTGMASLRNYLNSILQTAVNADEIEAFVVDIPVANALAKDATARTTAEAALITSARTDRTVAVNVSIEYSGAIHTISITLSFTA